MRKEMRREDNKESSSETNHSCLPRLKAAFLPPSSFLTLTQLLWLFIHLFGGQVIRKSHSHTKSERLLKFSERHQHKHCLMKTKIDAAEKNWEETRKRLGLSDSVVWSVNALDLFVQFGCGNGLSHREIQKLHGCRLAEPPHVHTEKKRFYVLPQKKEVAVEFLFCLRSKIVHLWSYASSSR